MPSWLIDDPTLVYLLLALIAFALCVGWWMNRGEEPGSMEIGSWLKAVKTRSLTRNQTYAFGLALTAVLAIALWIVGRVVMTDAKRIRLALEEMSAGVRQKNLDKIFKHVSEKFKKNLVNKQEMRQRVERHIRKGVVSAVNLWSIEKPVVSREKGIATIKFMVTPEGDLVGDGWYRCFATFVLDPDGEWRLQTFRVSLPTVDPETGTDIDLPP